ncbi:MAG: DNA mismatch repair protein MutL [Acidobacteria bacterium]|nr:DNA mismatch repair protein MutL [Acidobacteriota bacterium]
MAKIIRLPTELANKIAAGEVVERPASAVKELVENALDAGARRITVTIELGGKKLIRVEDDGEGMSRDDTVLALERHATSKLVNAADLAAIHTLGFRGEALPSVASVCHLKLRTRARGHDAGTLIQVNGGVLGSIREVGAPEGTLIEIGDLFYNLPARRKFLKSDAAESARVSRLLTQLALGYPEVGFSLTSAGRQVVRCVPAKTMAERFYQLYGDRPDLIEVGKEAGGLAVSGFVAALTEHGPSRGPQNIFVNRRIVKDRTITHAIIDSYSRATIKERRPEAHLFIKMPADRVDVNVHPMKAEVRFLDQSVVHEVVRRAIGEALGEAGAPGLKFQTMVTGRDGPTPVPIPGVMTGASIPSRWAPVSSAFVGESSASLAPGRADAGTSGLRTDAGARPMIALGQFRDTFIIAVDDEGIVVIDQHVAHERVLFERVMERLTSGRLESQRLLEPILIELSANQRQALAAHAEALERLGFEVEAFGGDDVRVRAVPALLGLVGCEAAIRALADDLDGLDSGQRVQDALRRIAATTACHAAVKANDPLTLDKMRHILDELNQTAYSTVCPHGRPVLLRLGKREIERSFERS